MDMPPERRLRRSRDDTVLTGSVGGLARYFGLNPTHLRIAFVAVSTLSGGFPGILAYLVLWAIIPADK